MRWRRAFSNAANFPACLEKPLRCEVAAGLPRHISDDSNTGWRRKAAATTFFNGLLDAVEQDHDIYLWRFAMENEEAA